MRNAIITLMIIIFVLLTLGCVSASDDNAMLSSGDMDAQLSMDDNENVFAQSDDSEVLSASTNYTGSTLSGLGTAIKNTLADTVYLENDIVQDTSNVVVINNNTGNVRVNTVDGKGHVIDLDGKSGAFTISINNFVFKNLVFKNGYRDKGGAIVVNSNTHVTFINCTFINNTAYTTNGGAIYGTSTGSYDLIGCNFMENYAKSYGGAVYSVALTADNCTFTDNRADSEGGAAFIKENSDVGDSYILNCVFNDNFALKNGGAALSYYGLTPIRGCTFTNNRASEIGGAFRGDGIVDGCIFTNNEAPNGGALYGDLSVNNCTFTDNRASSQYGGAIYFKENPDSGDCEISNSIFTGNYATMRGGAIYLKDGATPISNCVFNNNYLSDNSNAMGGAIFADDNSISISDCAFRNNTSPNGGALYVKLAVTISNSNFTSNIATQHGGAIYTNQSALTNCIFDSNSAVLRGGAFYGSCLADNCTFINNTAIDVPSDMGYGGACYLKSDSEITNSEFADNTALVSGGAVYSYSGLCTLDNCNFKNNVVTSDRSYGGAVYSYDHVNLTNCVLIDNSAVKHGGAVYLYSGPCHISDSIFINNKANEVAGAIYTALKMDLNNCSFTGNSAPAGGAIYGSFDMNGCTFTDNDAYNGDGGAAYLHGSSTLANSVFTGNDATRWGGAVYGIGTLSNCTFADNKVTVYDGGALYGDMTATDCSFTNNSAKRNGGALFAASAYNCTFEDCYAGNDGGAVYGDSKNIYYGSDSLFKNCSSGRYGNATFRYTLDNCTFVNCGNEHDATFQCNLTDCTFAMSPFVSAPAVVAGYGEAATVVANLLRDVTGIVTLTFNDATVDLPISNAQVSMTLHGLEIGTYGVSFYYPGSAKYLAETINTTLQIIKNPTPIASVDAENITYGDEAVIIANLADPATGSVSFTFNGNTEDVTIENGQATYTIADLNAGSYDVEVSYAGDSNYDAQTVTATVNVAKANPIISVEAPDIEYGEEAVITTNLIADVQGNVSVTVNGATGKTRISQGVATYAVSILKKGSYDVTVSYDGSDNYNAQSVSAVLNIAGLNPFISADSVPFEYGEDGTITIHMASDVPGNVNVAFNGATQKAKITNGVATYAVPLTKAGTYQAVLTYNGNYKYAVESITATVKINKNSAPIVSAVANDITYGQNATVTVHLAQNVPGNVKITVNNVAQKVKITNNLATAVFTGLKAGTYSAQVNYAGNVNYKAQTVTTSFNIAKGTPIVSADAPDITFGETGTITVSTAQNVPGNIKFTINGVTEKAKITDGVAAYTVSGLKCGSYVATIAYAGNVNYNAQTTTVSFNVVKADPITSVVVDDINVGDTAVVKVYVANNVNGNVKITVNGATEKVKIVNGVATLSVDGLKSGTFDVTAVYAGNANFNAQTATSSFTVSKSSPGLSVVATTSGGKTTLTASIASDAPGNVKIIMDGTTYTCKINSGTASTVVSGLASGMHTVKVTYGGNYKYTAQTITKTIVV